MPQSKGPVDPIVPDAGVVLYEFTGIMIGAGGSLPFTWPFGDDEDGDPVNLATGLFVLDKTDLVLPDIMPISLTRTYRPGDNASRAFGIGASHLYEMFLWSVNNYQEAELILPDGSRVHYVRISPGTNYQDAVYEHTSTPGAFYKSELRWNGHQGWDLRLKDGTVYVFGEFAPLQSIRDRYGNTLTITRDNGGYGNVTQITTPNGRWMQFLYDTSSRVSQVKDNTGRTVNYTYDTGGRLWKVTDPAGGVTEYTYDPSNRLLTIKDSREIVYLTNEYDPSGRVIRQTQADNTTYEFAYTVDGAGKITRTDVTDPRSHIRRVTFNEAGYTLSDTYALNLPEQQVFTYVRQAGTNLVQSATDSMNRRTDYAYDSVGNLTSETILAGTAEAITISATYEPVYSHITSVTDPLNHITSYAYDNKGSLISRTDPLNHQVTFAYNPAGQLVSMTDALQNITSWGYDLGDLVSLTNPLNNTTSRIVDGAGRPVGTTNALGQTNRYEYNSLNQVVRAIDSVREVARRVTDGEVIAGGGVRPEKLIPTPGGLKSGRRPDILVRRFDGSIYGINVGQQGASGAPLKREVEALYDLEEAGIPMFFVPYP